MIPAAASRPLQRRGVELWLPEDRVHGRPEQARLLDVRHLLQCFHRLHRIGGTDFRDGSAGEGLLDLRGRADGGECTRMDQRHAMAALGLVQVVGGDQDRDARLGEVVDEAPELPARQRIDPAGRFVEEEDRRLVENRTPEREPLPPAAGEIAGQRGFAALEAGHLDDELPARLDPVAGQAVNASPEPDVLVDGQQLVEREPLRHVADPLFDALGVGRDIDAADERGARGGPQQAAQHPDRGGLARAIAAEEPEDLAARDVERQVVDGDELSESPAQSTHLDRVRRNGWSGRGHGRPRARSSRAIARWALAIARVRSSSA